MQVLRETGRSALRAITRNDVARNTIRRMAHSRLLPSMIWRRLPVDVEFEVPVPTGRTFLYASKSDDLIGRVMFWRGVEYWEHDSVRLFCRLAKSARTVVDVGANTGVYSLLACAVNPDANVLAFEPVPRVYERLCQNVELNSFGSRCRIANSAVSDHVGAAKFHVPHNDLPCSSSLDTDGFRNMEGTLIDVPVTTLDAACKDVGLIDLVKIDVEGFEDKVLMGMPKILEESKPALIIECNPDGPIQAVQAILEDCGYEFFQPRDGRVVHMQNIVPDVTERFRNYLCLHESKANCFRL